MNGCVIGDNDACSKNTLNAKSDWKRVCIVFIYPSWS